MDDKSIVQLFWERNEKAIAEISSKYDLYCRKIAMNILGNEEDAKECINDAYLGLWNSIPPHKPQKLSAYLGKIIRNTALNMYKRDNAQKRGGSQIPLIFEELSEIEIPYTSFEDDMETDALVSCINEFLASLPADTRRVFVSRYFYSDSIKEISGRFGMTENNVSVTLSRTRTKLSKYLKVKGFEI